MPDDATNVMGQALLPGLSPLSSSPDASHVTSIGQDMPARKGGCHEYGNTVPHKPQCHGHGWAGYGPADTGLVAILYLHLNTQPDRYA